MSTGLAASGPRLRLPVASRRPHAGRMSDSRRSDPRLDQALRLHGEGRLRDALALYDEFLREHPGHAGALHYSGVVLYQSGDLGGALDRIRRSVNIDAGSADAWSNLGLVLQAIGHRRAAVEVFERAAQIAPDSTRNPGQSRRRAVRLGPACRRRSDRAPTDRAGWQSCQGLVHPGARPGAAGADAGSAGGGDAGGRPGTGPGGLRGLQGADRDRHRRAGQGEENARQGTGAASDVGAVALRTGQRAGAQACRSAGRGGRLRDRCSASSRVMARRCRNCRS